MKLKAVVQAIRFFITSIPTKTSYYYGTLKFFVGEFISFHVLVFLYLVNSFVVRYLHLLPLIPKTLLSNLQGSYSRFYIKVTGKLDSRGGATITKMDIIGLAIRNMQAKKARTLVTIGGVSIGIGAIVFLVSIGYGLQDLVITRVAKLEELRQIEVSPQAGSRIKIDDRVISDIRQYPDVEDVYPMISVVGRVNYQNSVSDMAVYGVTTGYLENSAIQPIEGSVFDSDALSYDSNEINSAPVVAGVSDERSFYTFGEELGRVTLDIPPNIWVSVRSAPSSDAPILGMTKRMEGTQTGLIVAGSPYDSGDRNGRFYRSENGDALGKWIKTTVYVWEEAQCAPESQSCIDAKYLAQVDESGYLKQVEGYLDVVNIETESYEILGEVLGESNVLDNDTLLLAQAEAIGSTSEIQNDRVSSTTNVVGEGDWVEILDEDYVSEENNVQSVALSDSAVKQAVVNVAMLKILDIPPEEAVGKNFSVSFVVPTYLASESSRRIESVPADYTIVGVTPDDSAPIFYVPFIDLRSLGVMNYSQLKIVSAAQDTVSLIRQQVEASGFATASVVDTIEQITSLFASIRLVLGIMGMIALAVASLGMFNTLTVSLLERSREVGLMKAMGMTTTEVQELFLTESIIMGFCAGIAGLSVGWVFGKLVGGILTIFSILQGQGVIDISYIPFSFVAIIMFLSFLVGIGTGIFPARRSKKISALDALRYE